MRERMFTSVAAVAMLYLLNGVVTASVGPRLPEISDNLGIGLGALGLALAGQVVGLIAAMPLSARLVHRFGARAVASIAAAMYSIAIALVGLASSPIALFAALLIAGMANAPLDVAVPTLGKGVEDKRGGRKTLSLFELAFVVGLLGGGAVGAAAAGRVEVQTHLGAVAGVCIVLALAAGMFLPANGASPEPHVGMFRVIRERPLIRKLALIALAGLWAEAVGIDWSALFTTDVLGAPSTQQGIPGLCFVVGIGGALLVGGTLADRVGSVAVVRWGGVLIAVGMTVVVASHSVALASAGFLIAGVGLANVHPLALSAAGAGPARGAAFAAVNAISYIGLFAEKPGIGLLAGVTSLRFALATMVVVGVLVALGARLVNEP